MSFTTDSLPVFLLALPAGALADIIDRGRMLIFTQAWMAITAILLGAHGAWPHHIYVSTIG